MITIPWPPTYQIKRHRNARYVKLRMVKSHGLVITVPYRFNIKEIPAIIERHKQWVMQQWDKWQENQDAALPESISLQGIAKSYQVYYMACDSRLRLFERPQNELVVMGKVADKALCKALLTTWAQKQAKVYLAQLLQAVSARTHLSYERLIIRNQRTIWGSCTHKKRISLNYKLIFLPPNLVTHVLIHELCHTLHLNHSQQFWAQVAAHDANWQEHKKLLRKAEQFIPSWVVNRE